MYLKSEKRKAELQKRFLMFVALWTKESFFYLYTVITA